jgi:L-aspartate oxidase
MKKHLEPKRYLCGFDSKKLPHVFTDVLVIGSGVAGLRAAVEAAKTSKVLVLAKGSMTESNTMYAQGGVAAVMSRRDSRKLHVADTMATGGGLSDEDVVRTIVDEGPKRVRELHRWGARFDREDGRLALTLEGGHSRSRVVHAKGDATGSAIAESMLAKVLGDTNILIRENTFVIDLVSRGNEVLGALCSGSVGGKLMIWAEQVILASGGLGQLYQETTNTDMATGDGVALAYRAGAVVRDMEFVQFHPTTLYLAGAARLLISEAVRGEGGVLVNNRGEAFMERYDPKADLAPRDVVSRSILSEMKATSDTNVYLDMSRIPKRRRLERFPTICEHCVSFGLDPAKDPIPVRPSAHYMIGGVKAGITGATNLKRLFAVGEVASTGLHGANRLASNSLLEGLVMGARAGAAAGSACKGVRVNRRQIEHPGGPPESGILNIADVRRSLKSLMWRHVGVERSGESLTKAHARIDTWCQYVMSTQFENPVGWELQNMLTAAKIVTEAATRREESRGTHFRMDFPETDDATWKRHIEFKRPGG